VQLGCELENAIFSSIILYIIDFRINNPITWNMFTTDSCYREDKCSNFV